MSHFVSAFMAVPFSYFTAKSES